VRDQPDYAQALCALGVIDAALGNKKDAIREGERAVELIPVSKSAIEGPDLDEVPGCHLCLDGRRGSRNRTDRGGRACSALSQLRVLKFHPYWDSLRGDLLARTERDRQIERCDEPRNFFAELKRPNVYKVAIADR